MPYFSRGSYACAPCRCQGVSLGVHLGTPAQKASYSAPKARCTVGSPKKKNEQMKSQPDGGAVGEKAKIREDECLSGDDCDYRNIHRISDIAIEPADYEVPRWEHRRRR